MIRTCSGPFPVHTPYFLVAFCGLIFIHFLPSSLMLRKQNFCCLTKPHDLETWRPLEVQRTLYSMSPITAHLFTSPPSPPPHPPYNPRFIVYFMTIIPLRLITIFWALFFPHKWFLLFLLITSSSHFCITMHRTVTHCWYSHRNSLQFWLFSSPVSHSSPFNSGQRIPLTSFHHNGVHITHLPVPSKL